MSKVKEIMISSVEKAFEGFIYERWEEASNSIAMENREYIEIGEKQSALLKKLSESLNEEQKKLLRQFEELETERDCVCINLLYRQAVKDGIELSSVIFGNNKI